MFNPALHLAITAARTLDRASDPVSVLVLRDLVLSAERATITEAKALCAKRAAQAASEPAIACVWSGARSAIINAQTL